MDPIAAVARALVGAAYVVVLPLAVAAATLFVALTLARWAGVF